MSHFNRKCSVLTSFAKDQEIQTVFYHYVWLFLVDTLGYVFLY